MLEYDLVIVEDCVVAIRSLGATISSASDFDFSTVADDYIHQAMLRTKESTALMQVFSNILRIARACGFNAEGVGVNSRGVTRGSASVTPGKNENRDAP